MNKPLQIILAVVASTFLMTTIFLFDKFSSSVDEVESLTAEKSDLEDEIFKLKSENKILTQENTDLENEISNLNKQMSNTKRLNAISNNRFSYGSAPVRTITGNAMETKIDGEFEGWDGETIFKMMNGSIWQQDSYAYTYHYAYMPDVIIYSKNGSTYMKVEGVRDEIRVKRIR